MSVYERMLERYAAGDLPWDDALPPPEIQEFARTLSPGRALDLGCGTGRAAIYLSRLGWQVDAVDFIPQAITMARQRAQKANVSARFYVASVTELDFLTDPYDLVVDVGCAHALQESELVTYYQHLLRLIHGGGHYLLFARLRDQMLPTEEDLRGINEAYLRRLFYDGFIVNRTDYGRTQMDDDISWRSAWFWYIRRRQRVQ
jgi:SAM-dependent methyltransferase